MNLVLRIARNSVRRVSEILYISHQVLDYTFAVEAI